MQLSSATIDLNADLGESFGRWQLGDDDAMLRLVTSASIACGFHAGDPTVLRSATERAVEHGVVIGAHVGYRDLSGFGRRFIDVDPAELTNDVIYQIAALDGFARIAGDRVRYVKPHGALYNVTVHHDGQAAAVVDAVHRYDPSLPILGLPSSRLLDIAAERGLAAVGEACTDRAYTAAGSLVPRDQSRAVISDVTEVTERSVRFATKGSVIAVDGTVVPVSPRSLCVHGDTPDAVVIAGAVRDALSAAGVTVCAFAR